MAKDAAPSSPFGPDGQREDCASSEDNYSSKNVRSKNVSVLFARTGRGDIVHGVDPSASALGIAPGQRATDVMALYPELAVAYADPAAEDASLGRLAAWMRRWSPLTRADGVDSIALDATGGTHLFGGERAMLEGIRDKLAALGLTARLAMAPNHAAAYALARHGTKADEASANENAPIIVDEGSLAEALAFLPVAALRIDPASITVLRRLGLKTIGQLAAIPRPALKKRFGAGRKHRDPRDDTPDDYLGRSLDRSSDVLARLDEALGRAIVPLDPEQPTVPHRVVRGLVEPVLDVPVALASARPLVETLVHGLEQRAEGVRGLVLEAFRVDGGRASAALRLSQPTRNVDHIMRLLAERVSDWRAEFGIDALVVEAVEIAPLPPNQMDAEGRKDAPDPHALIDRLSARLGPNAVLQAVPLASHWPERAEAWVPASTVRDRTVQHRTAQHHTPQRGNKRTSRTRERLPGGADSPVLWTETGAPPLPRPDRLFDPPEAVAVIHAVPDGPPARFTWRRVAHDVARSAGPERIAPEWWRERSTARARDYWRVETHEGRRLWLYREGFEEDEREGRPRWFVHGLFA